MATLAEQTSRVERLSTELRALIDRRNAAKRDGRDAEAATLTTEVDRQAQELERLADDLQASIAGAVALVADRHSRAFELAARDTLREQKILGELARIRGHLTLDLDRAVAVAMSPNALVNPWNGDTLGAPKTVPTDVLPESARSLICSRTASMSASWSTGARFTAVSTSPFSIPRCSRRPNWRMLNT
jgi:hypothetical protein